MPADTYSLGIGVNVDRDAVAAAFDDLRAALEEEHATLDRLSEALIGAGGTEAADDAAEAIEDLSETTEETTSRFAAMGAAFAWMAESVWTGFGKLVGATTAFSNSMRAGFDFMKSYEDMEEATQRLSVQMGGGRLQAAGMRDEMLKLGIATIAGMESVTKLAVGMGNAGVRLSEFGFETQKAMANLQAAFGLSGEDIAKTTRGLQLMGGTLDNLLGDATAFTKGFGIPGVMQALPGIVSNAQTIMLRFGGSIGVSGQTLARNTMNLAGVFSKTYGVTMTEAVGKASAVMQKFAAASSKDRGVFLGLDDDFSELTKTLMSYGMGLFDAMDLTKKAGEGNLASLDQLATKLDEMPDGFMKERFREQLRRELPEEMFGLVNNIDKLHARMKDDTAAKAFANSFGGKGVESFNRLSDSMWESTKGMRSLFNSIIEFGKAVVGNTFGPILTDIFKKATDRFQTWATQLHKFTQSSDFRAWVERLRPIFTKVGEAVLTLGTILGGVGTSIGGLFAVTKGGAKAISLLGTPIAWLSNLIPGLGSSVGNLSGMFGSIGGVIGKIVGKAGPIGMVITAFEGVKTAVFDMGAVLGNPNATGMEKLEALFRGTLKGIGAAVNTILLGIPGKIADYFFPDMEHQFNVGFKGIWDWVKNKFATAGPGLMSSISGWLESASYAFHDFMKGLGPWLSSFGKNIGGSIGGLLKMGFEFGWSALKTYWENLKWYDLLLGPIGAVVPWFRSLGGKAGDGLSGGLDDALLSIGIMLQDLGNGILTFLGGVWEGVLGAFGETTTTMSLRWGLVTEEIIAKAEYAGDWIWDAFANLFDRLYIGWLQIGATIDKALIYIKFGALVAWDFIKDGFIDVADSIALGALGISGALEKAWIYVKGGALVAWEMLTSKVQQAMLGMQLGVIEGARAILGGFKTLAGGVIDTMAAAVNALPDIIPGVKEMKAGLAGAKTAVDGLGSGLDTMAAGTRASMDAASKASDERIAGIGREMLAQTSAIDQRMAGERQSFADQKAARDAAAADRAKDRDAQLAAVDSVMESESAAANARIDAREAQTEANARQHQQNMDNMQAALSAEMDANDRRQRNAMEAERFSRSQEGAVETTLASFAADASKMQGMTDKGLEAGRAALKDYMDKSMASIGKAVAKGEITADQAAQRLRDASATGMEAARKAAMDASNKEMLRGATETADTAAGAGPTAQLDASAADAIFGQFQQNLQSAQRVDVRLSGDGRVTQALAREAAVANHSTNGG